MDLHLTPARIADLLAGRCSEEEEQALAAHLAAGDCPDCEAGLMALSPAEGERLLEVLARVDDPPALDLKPAAKPTAAARPQGRWVWLWAPVATAAAALLIFLFWPAQPPAGGDGGDLGQRTKGQVSSWTRVTMTVGQVLPARGGQSRVERVRDGQALAAGTKLVFQLRLEEACWPYLVHASDGAPALLLPLSLDRQSRLPQGQHTPRTAGKPLGVDTAGLAGLQTFICLCSRSELTDRAAILRAATRDEMGAPIADRLQVRIADEADGP